MPYLKTALTTFVPLRNRFCFLFSKSGILRCESLFNAELSDTFFVSNQGKLDVHKWDALVMTIFNGKTNKDGAKVYGRVMRARLVDQCAIGAYGFYLLARFEISKEFEEGTPIDFTRNKSWYDIKMLVGFDRRGKEKKYDTRTRMDASSYDRAIRKILKCLKIPSSHIKHLGRMLGSMELQFLEALAEELQIMGNWQPSIQEKHYSIKLPISAMRKMGGHDESFYCPRSEVTPPEKLEKMIFPFVESHLDKVEAAIIATKDGKRSSYGAALYFLDMLKRMRRIILQDAAAMIVEFPDRKSHPIFKLSVFKDPEFDVSRILGPNIQSLTFANLSLSNRLPIKGFLRKDGCSSATSAIRCPKCARTSSWSSRNRSNSKCM